MRVAPATIATGLARFLRMVPSGGAVDETALERLGRILDRLEATLRRETYFPAAVTVLSEHLAIRISGAARRGTRPVGPPPAATCTSPTWSTGAGPAALRCSSSGSIRVAFPGRVHRTRCCSTASARSSLHAIFPGRPHGSRSGASAWARCSRACAGG